MAQREPLNRCANKSGKTLTSRSPVVSTRDIGAGMRKLQQRADIADLDRMKTLWGNLTDAQRNRFFDEVIRPWLDLIEKDDAIERT